MNNHGDIMFVTVYETKFPRVPDHKIPETRAFSTRVWHVTGRHIHRATDNISIHQTLEEARGRIKKDFPDAVPIGAHMDDPDNIVETWVLPWGDDSRVRQL